MKGRPLAKAGYEQELTSIRGFIAMQNRADSGHGGTVVPVAAADKVHDKGHLRDRTRTNKGAREDGERGQTRREGGWGKRANQEGGRMGKEGKPGGREDGERGQTRREGGWGKRANQEGGSLLIRHGNCTECFDVTRLFSSMCAQCIKCRNIIYMLYFIYANCTVGGLYLGGFTGSLKINAG